DFSDPKDVVGAAARPIFVRRHDLTAGNVEAVYGPGVPGFPLGVGYLGPVGSSVTTVGRHSVRVCCGSKRPSVGSQAKNPSVTGEGNLRIADVLATEVRA